MRDYLRRFHQVRLLAVSIGGKNRDFALTVQRACGTPPNPLQSIPRVDPGWIYAADGPSTPSELGDRLI